MRISERKRKLRDQSGAPIERVAHTATPKTEEPRARVSRERVGRATPRTTRSTATAQTTRKPRTRSPRFYAGFGFVGLVFSAILAESTYANYNSAVTKYHAAVATYPQLLAHYKVALAKFQAAHSAHLVKPHAPAIPHNPTLGIGDFLLPILYGSLSVAYLYLAYRTVKAGQNQT